jgi:RNA polymerase sigma factor (sigma-70 family)
MALSAEEIERVYERRYAGFRLGACAILNDFDAAHDAVQDGFARALVDREKCRSGSPEAWIWRIIERKALDELRRRRRRTGTLEDAFDAAFVVSESNPALAAAVKKLAPRRRLVVFLRYFADLSYADIARVCGMSEGTVAATLAQAHAELLRRLELEGTRR